MRRDHIFIHVLHGRITCLWFLALLLVGVLLGATSAQAAPFAYITNSVSDTVSVIDTATNAVTATIPVGSAPYGVAVTPNGAFVYVTNVSSDTVSVIDTATNAVTATIPVGNFPRGIAVTLDGNFVYVANTGSDTVSVIDTSTNTVTATISVRFAPDGIAFTPNGAFAYVTSHDSVNGTVSVIDISTNTVTTTIPVGFGPNSIAFTPNGAFAYVTNFDSGGTVSVIDTSTNTVTTTIVVGVNERPAGVAVTPDGAFVYATRRNGDSVSVIDTSTNVVTATIPVGSAPYGVAVTPNGNFVYVANVSEPGTVSVINTTTNIVTATIPVGGGPVASGQFIGPPATPPPTAEVPVVLVHGFLGSPDSFGGMRDLLERDLGVAVEPFDYGEFTQGPADVTIEQLAGLLSFHIRQVLEDHPGANQVDVVAHSMGGLLARAWMSGMTKPEFCPTCAQIPYEGQIRKLILIGTPNYGADAARLGGWCDFWFAVRGTGCSDIQAEELRFGSKFIATLHDEWNRFQQSSPHRFPLQNALVIVGTQGTSRSVECNDTQGCDDGIVDISSAVLPESHLVTSRYVPYRHADISIIPPREGMTLVGVNDDKHKTFLLVREYLQSSMTLGQCCGANTVDYNPPHLRGVIREQEGLLLVRLVDAVTHNPIAIVPGTGVPRLNLRPVVVFRQQYNADGGAITAWGIKAPQVYRATVQTFGYRNGVLTDVPITIALPTVPERLELSRR